MTRPEQRQFVTDLTNSILKSVLQQLDAVDKTVTENWDGHELRVLLADEFEDSASMSLIRREPRRKRARDYHNARLVSFP